MVLETTEIVVGGFLGIWLVLTILWNIPKLDAVVFRFLPAGRWVQMVPSWSFFAPLPCNRDYVLFYRDRYDSGSLSTWREVLSEGAEWTLGRMIWNPGSRPRKALSDAVSYLLTLVHSGGERQDSGDALVLSVPYLLLLNKVSRLPAELGVTGRQFLIMKYSITAPDPELVFLSKTHDLE
jgi:hypothetical protein